jgi:DNA-binding transcriptional regulator LsrR (DeoR family)
VIGPDLPEAPDTSLAPAPEIAAVDRDEQQATRAAWLYFIGGLTQAQVAKRLGVNRIRVNRLLAQAREQGLVQIRVTGRLADCIALEEKLKECFHLADAVVVPTPPDQSRVPYVIGNAAGVALAERLEDGMAVGVGWGRTLRLSLRSVPRRPMNKLSVISLLGGLTRGAAMNPYETASHLADLVNASCYYIAAPALADSQLTKNVLMAQPMLREVFGRGEAVDLAFLSVGELSNECTMAKVGLVDGEDVKSLRTAGAAGDICVHWIDRRGRIVDHPLNLRSIALPPTKLSAIPCVILASGGKQKIDVIHGALHGKMANVLVTDEFTAKGVLALAARIA